MNITTIRNGLLAIAVVGAAGLGGSAIAGAAGTSATATPTATSTATATAPDKDGDGHAGGRHVGANGVREKALSGDVAAKVKAAALAKYPGATIERVETDADHGSPYEAHVTTKDGQHLEVLVNSSFAVTASNSMGHH